MRKFLPQNRNSIGRTTRYIWAPTLYAAKAKVRRIQRGHQPSCTMVWWGVQCNGAIVIHFCMPGVKSPLKSMKKPPQARSKATQ